MNHFVYVLGSIYPKDSRTYVGWSNDVSKRLIAHNAGTGARSTRGRIWIVLYVERFDSRKDAMSREWYLKKDRKFRRRLKSNLEYFTPFCDRPH